MGRSVYQRVQDEKEVKAELENIGVANSEIDLMTGIENEMDVDGEEEEEGEGEEEEEEGEEGEEGDENEGEGDEGEEEGEEENEEQEEEEEEKEENDIDDVVKGCTVFVRYVLYLLSDDHPNFN